MYFDITTPDTAYDWIYEALKINSGQFIEDYILKCHKNIDMFCELYDKQIEKLDVENIEVVAFQVTSCNDYCASIKKNGIRNLQWVLNNETEMKDFFFRKWNKL